MKIKNADNTNSNLITLKDNEWLKRQRIAGKTVASALSFLANLVKEKANLSLLEMNNLAEELIIKNNCSCTFKGYKGFPAGVCVSVNKQLVHGIPTSYKLQEGDVVSFDLGATYEGAIADAAITCIFGEAKSLQHLDLIKTTKECLDLAIASINSGKKLGIIGNIIYKYATSKGYGVIINYGGHGLDYNKPHSVPFVSNKSNVEDGIIAQPGLTIAIEPMLTVGLPITQTSSDGWTVSTPNIGAHFEHTVFVHQDRVEIITESK